jgi:2-polyprenyl-3-methyl-5-hydroxy-6-metoxy-1,4-benzoquinol methylase
MKHGGDINMDIRKEQLEKIAVDYHTNEKIPDIHIENMCQEYFIEWLLKQIPKSAHVLELGFGDGLVTSALAQSDCQLTLIEGAKTLVDIASSKHPNIKCIETLFEEFYPKNRFDVILASHVLEHVDNPQELLKLMATWLTDTGKIIVVVPNRNSLHRQLAVIVGLQPSLDTLSKRDLLVGHQRVYSLDILKEHISESGLIPVESIGFFLKVLPNAMMLEYSQELIWGLNAISNSLPPDMMANIAVIASKYSVIN